ncbi:F-box protein At5g52880-like isoform X2 [Wolffia australiana]
MGDGAMARYEGLGIREALRRSYDYAGACTELGFVMRGAYSKLPKNLQLAVFQDTLSAFRLLPDVQTSAGLSSAHALHQASEASLPKQRKAAATSEFRRAVVSQKRRCRVQEEDEGSRQLPEDIMVNIFSYLDLKSLACASLVSRLWNSAANDYSLWGLQYSLHFGDYESTKESLKASFKQKYMDRQIHIGRPRTGRF